MNGRRIDPYWVLLAVFLCGETVGLAGGPLTSPFLLVFDALALVAMIVVAKRLRWI